MRTEEIEIEPIAVKNIISNNGKLTDDELNVVKGDIKTIVRWFNDYRRHNNEFIIKHGLVATSKELDPYYLHCGGAELTKLASKDWQMAIKIAREKGELKALKDADPNQEGFDYEIFSKEMEAKSRAYMWAPGKVIPNQWTGNKYSQCKTPLTMLLSIGCHFDGMIKKYWAALVKLTGHPDGKSGDWKYSAKSNDNAFSTFTLTKEVTRRPSYQQLFGQAEDDFGYRGDGNALKGMKIVLENV